MKLQYFATVKQGRLIIQNRKSFNFDIEALEGKQLVLTIEKKRKSRSLPQNRYYWAAVVPIIREGLIDAGWTREDVGTLEQVHEILKHKFCKVTEIVNTDTGEILSMPPTTTQLTTTDMMDYIDDIKRWAAEFLGIVIPDPNEQVNLF